jgi:cell wall-associated NlpC family hydrolase
VRKKTRLALALVLFGVTTLGGSRVRAQEVPSDPGLDQGITAALESGAASLADVEVYSQTLHGDARDGGGDLAGAELYEAGALVIDVDAINAAAKAAALARAQAELSARCDMNAPAGTLRDGAEAIGLGRICRESVAKAPTPKAAEALIFLFENLGVPYSAEQRQTPGFFDCSSYIMSAYRVAGVPVVQFGGILPSSHSIAPHSGYNSYPWLETVSAKNARPGDIFAWVPPDRVGHVAVKLWGGYMVHTARTGDVSHIRSDQAYGPPAVIRRVKP